MNQLEYQAECALTRYPFRDNATLLWTCSGISGRLNNDIFLDAQVTVFNNLVGTLYLSSIIYNGTDYAFIFSGLASITLVSSSTGFQTLSSRDSANNVLLALDIDIDALNRYFSDLALVNGTYLFDTTNVLCLACIRLLPPTVNRITLKNTTPGGLVTVDDVAAGAVNFYEGTNTGFTNVTSLSEQVDISSGLGAGLYNSCPEPGSQILTINNTSPDSLGNFYLQTDSCYSTHAGYSEGDVLGLCINNDCLPECTSDNLVNFAHYLNRVTNLSNELTGYIETANTGYNCWLADYSASETDSTVGTAPYILAQSTTVANQTLQFHNITYGIYSPSQVTTTVSLEVSCGSASLTYAAGSNYIVQDNINNKLPDPVVTGNNSTLLTNRALGSNAVFYGGFVLKQAASISNTGSNANDVKFSLTSASASRSGFVLPLNPTTFNYNIVYSVVVGAVKTITITIDLRDPSQVISNTTLNINTPGTCKVTRSSLTLNQVTSDMADKGFNNISIDYSKNNTYTLILTCTDISTTQSLTISGSSSTGATTKTISV